MLLGNICLCVNLGNFASLERKLENNLTLCIVEKSIYVPILNNLFFACVFLCYCSVEIILFSGMSVKY
jgi:hypothetical protein